jgi:putative transposase
MYYYKGTKDDSMVIEKLRELALRKPMEGQDKMYDRIRLEGYTWNYKRVRRVYLLLGLNKRKKMKRRVPARVKEPLNPSLAINQLWSLDFMSDALVNGRKFRVLNIIDDCNRSAVSIEADYSMPAPRLILAMKRAIHACGKPQKIRVDNGPEFISQEFTDWCFKQDIKIQYIQPGKPMQNGYIERFNRTFREDVLDASLFEDIMQVNIESEIFRDDYNNNRPHESLGGVPPARYQVQSPC